MLDQDQQTPSRWNRMQREGRKSAAMSVSLSEVMQLSKFHIQRSTLVRKQLTEEKDNI